MERPDGPAPATGGTRYRYRRRRGSTDLDPADTFEVHTVVRSAAPSDYDALLMPGGTVNADKLRVDPDVRAFVQEIFRAGKPVGVICHAPWTLIDAGLARGRTLTSFPSVWTEHQIQDAGSPYPPSPGGADTW